MIKLYGLKFSNYYGLIKTVMIEKGLEFEEVKAPPVQEEENLQRSPMGKMPSIEINGQYLSESLAIFHYLEAIAPEPALLPKDAFASAKVMELVCHIKLDVELVARRLLPEVLFKKPVSDETKDQVRADLAKGLKAVHRLAKFSPYIAGDNFTLADLYAYYSYGLAGQLAKGVAGFDLMAECPEMANLMAELAKRPSIERVAAESGR